MNKFLNNLQMQRNRTSSSDKLTDTIGRYKKLNLKSNYRICHSKIVPRVTIIILNKRWSLKSTDSNASGRSITLDLNY
jgi:hypothetical protein